MDQAELAQLYRRHGPMVFRRARQILGNEADAGEVVQDVFLSLFEKPAQFAGASSLTTFLYSATTHACLNRLRNQRGRAKLNRAREAELAPGDTEPLTQEQLLMLQTTLRNMPPELAHVAVYHFMDGLTQDEIAEVMSCSRRHVGNQLARALRWVEAREVT
ncbi:MAG TPA: sigma-70 family RNA polymerase sigma factor [Polyangiaceae bacterium]|nr:sigma-70 family RNA polymerase sigma factor [Polyangiaceae bacterium]